MRQSIGGATKSLADAVSEGLIIGPRVVQCGRGLSQTGILMTSSSCWSNEVTQYQAGTETLGAPVVQVCMVTHLAVYVTASQRSSRLCARS